MCHLQAVKNLTSLLLFALRTSSAMPFPKEPKIDSTPAFNSQNWFKCASFTTALTFLYSAFSCPIGLLSPSRIPNILLTNFVFFSCRVLAATTGGKYRSLWTHHQKDLAITKNAGTFFLNLELLAIFLHCLLSWPATLIFLSEASNNSGKQLNNFVKLLWPILQKRIYGPCT